MSAFLVVWFLSGFVAGLVFFYNSNLPKGLTLGDVFICCLASIFGLILVPPVVWYCLRG